MYGDRDYICNWLGDEAVSLAINSTLSPGFAIPGYVPVFTGGTHVKVGDVRQWSGVNSGGLVRQYGNLSFSRVFQAGHMGRVTSS